MNENRTCHQGWIYVLYGILVIVMTVLLLYGRTSPIDEKLTVVETVSLLPGVTLFFPLLMITGGKYTSLFPFSIHTPLLGMLNVFAYLTAPLAIRATIGRWREWKTSGHSWLDIFRKPTTMVVLGVGMLLLALDGAIHIWHGTDGPTDFANMVLGLFAAVGFVFLAHYLWRHGASVQFTSQALPAWTRRAVPLAGLVGGVIGGGLTYGEARIVGWSTTSASALAVTVTIINVLAVCFAFRLFQRQLK